MVQNKIKLHQVQSPETGQHQFHVTFTITPLPLFHLTNLNLALLGRRLLRLGTGAPAMKSIVEDCWARSDHLLVGGEGEMARASRSRPVVHSSMVGVVNMCRKLETNG